MSANFQNAFTSRLSSKFLAKHVNYTTTPETRRHTTLWNINVRKTETTWCI